MNLLWYILAISVPALRNAMPMTEEDDDYDGNEGGWMQDDDDYDDDHHYSHQMSTREAQLAHVPYCVDDDASVSECISCPIGIKIYGALNMNDRGLVAVGNDKADDTIVVVFRGSKYPILFARDVVEENLDFVSFHNCTDTGGECLNHRVHGPYQDIYQQFVETGLFAVVQSAAIMGKSNHVKVIGHSLGGALGTLFAYDLVRERHGLNGLTLFAMTTFGSPRVVNRPVVKYFDVHASYALLTRVDRAMDDVSVYPRLAATRRLGVAPKVDSAHVGNLFFMSNEHGNNAHVPSSEPTVFTNHVKYFGVALTAETCPLSDSAKAFIENELCIH